MRSLIDIIIGSMEYLYILKILRNIKFKIKYHEKTDKTLKKQ